MNTNKIISSEKIVLDTPPDMNELKKLSDKELISICNKLFIPREQYEASIDADKNRLFMINEVLRLQPPIPDVEKPVLVDTKYDEETMTKTNTFRYLKHTIIDGEYKHSVKTLESYKQRLTQKELDNQKHNILIDSINEEISELDLNDYLNKDSIMKFACDNGKSSGEKRLRVNALLKAIQPLLKEKLQRELSEYNSKENKIKPRYEHIRITNFDISVY
jgi:hypothetical protein